MCSSASWVSVVIIGRELNVSPSRVDLKFSSTAFVSSELILYFDANYSMLRLLSKSSSPPSLLTDRMHYQFDSRLSFLNFMSKEMYIHRWNVSTFPGNAELRFWNFFSFSCKMRWFICPVSICHWNCIFLNQTRIIVVDKPFLRRLSCRRSIYYR